MIGRIARVALLVALILSVGAASASAAPKKGPKAATIAGTCWVDGDVVHGSGLPSDEVINFLIIGPDGSQDGWVLGHSSWWNVSVPERTGETLYQFISAQKGKDGRKYTVFAECWGS